MNKAVPIFDGHNDVPLRFHNHEGGDAIALFLNGGGPGHIDVPRSREGKLVGGLFALYSPSLSEFDVQTLTGDTYDLPLPEPLDRDVARSAILRQASMMLRLERESGGTVAICRSVSEVRGAVKRGALAVVLHIEGADAIDDDLHLLDVLHGIGLRSLGPVWSRHNAFGHGVPFRFPGTPDTGPGLTEKGFALVRACNRLGIMLDVSHITEQGFWDVAKTSEAPIVATHSNAFSLCHTPRNLTDRQLDAIRDSDGLVGLNFATSFLREDGQMRGDTELEVMIRHLDALIGRLGETRVALGSDFDGAVVPDAIGSASGLPALVAALRVHGYDDALLTRLGTENWLSMLGRTIG